ncbi:hypothetical protein [Bifidobacterium ruminantium]|uniref:hypothetical protein n=1 Tax=Bifidobacterium ruminantium TaxID=78346 RepID=UPI0024908DDB|nr:hypothetical protein [Bifidobacterium ruminantium]
MSDKIIQFDDAMFESKLDALVRVKVEQILNAMLDAEADEHGVEDLGHLLGDQPVEFGLEQVPVDLYDVAVGHGCASCFPIAILCLATENRTQDAGHARFNISTKNKTESAQEFGRYRQMAGHPNDMTAGWAGLSASWFSFDVFSKGKPTQDDLTILSSSTHHHPGVDQFTAWPNHTKGGLAFGRFYEQTLLMLPVVNVLFQKALWASVLPFFLVFVSLRNKDWWRMLILNMPIIATLLTLVAGPTSAYGEAVRYVLPLVYTIPLFLCISLFVMRQQSEA